MSEKVVVIILLLAVAFSAFCVMRSFAVSLDRHVFEAGVTFDESGVVVSTETIKVER